MFNVTALIAEELIRKAEKEGKFEDLEGMGRPLAPDEAANLPPDLRMAYRILKSSGHLPADILEEKEINCAIDLLEHMDDEQERYRQVQKLNVMILQMNERRRRPVTLDTSGDYYRRIVEKVRIAEERFGKPGKEHQ
ncbi:DnaJ-like domain-containing protein [Pseudodesulfovibrio mercurii]|uniref:DnaJ-like domain-containing protein n=1 Tax=Pseudodesulfovibrio mercurii TaxID=641491 RepID=F0JDD5_9BACT|nr:DnaJ family domain-containing protein [Pseudodesulfovibrio mercurii]EGB15809.1 DnaJ-like domain-containing protein [Pseudodesulfovibrio mercurii]